MGVSKDATQDQIKRAYRQKAKEYHPDINKAPEAAEMMKKVNVAYDVLSDAQKKQQYDTYGQAGPQQHTQQTYQGYGFDERMFEEIFRQFHQQSNGQNQQYQQRRRVFNPFSFFFRIMIFMYIFDFIIYLFRALLFG